MEKYNHSNNKKAPFYAVIAFAVAGACVTVPLMCTAKHLGDYLYGEDNKPAVEKRIDSSEIQPVENLENVESEVDSLDLIIDSSKIQPLRNLENVESEVNHLDFQGLDF